LFAPDRKAGLLMLYQNVISFSFIFNAVENKPIILRDVLEIPSLLLVVI